MNKWNTLKLKNKKKLITASIAVSFISSPLILVSCSSTNNNENEHITQTWIDKKYNDFSNAIQLNPNIYLEYFLPFDSVPTNDSFEIDKQLISKIFNIDFGETNSKIFGQYKDNKLTITYKLLDKNNIELIPSPNVSNNKVIEIKKISEIQIENIKQVLNEWTNYIVSVSNSKNKIVNLNDQTEISKINPVFLDDAFNDERNKFFKSSLTNFMNIQLVKTILDNNKWQLKFNINLNLDGTISIDVFISTNDGINFNLNNVENKKTKKYEGFKTNKTSQEEIIVIYKDIGKSYNLSSLNQEKKYPLFASSIYSQEKLANFLVELNKKVNNETKFKLPEYFNPNTNKNDLWYELNVPLINSNDVNGVVNANFELKDKFTDLLIIPQNITKTLTLINFQPLVVKDINNNNSKDDYSQMENVYRAYNIFKELELKTQYINLPSSTQVQFDLAWLKQNTNINDKITFEADDSFYIESEWINQKPESETATTRKTKFRIKPNSIDNQAIINDDVNGIKSVKFLLEMEADLNELGLKWYTVLPQQKTAGSSIKPLFGSKTDSEAFISVGKYKTNDLDIASLIYDEINNIAQNSIVIDVSEQKILENLFKQNQATAIGGIKKDIIDPKIFDILRKSNVQQITNNISDLMNKFGFVFELANIPFKATQFDSSNNPIKIETDLVDFKLSSKNSEDTFFDYYKNNGKNNFPKIKFVIEFKKN